MATEAVKERGSSTSRITEINSNLQGCSSSAGITGEEWTGLWADSTEASAVGCST